MAQEQQLRDRWRDALATSGEYQTALRGDAVTRNTRDAQARAAIQRELQHGDAFRAADLQSQLLGEQSRDRLGTGGGRVAGLEAAQRAREDDYIAQARQRGSREFQQFATGHQGPASVATSGARVLDMLDPDFSQHFPYMSVRPVFGPSARGGRAAGRGQTVGGGQTLGGAPDGPETNAYGVSREMIEANAPTRAMLDNRAQDLETATQTRIRRDQALRNTLPSDLLETYSTMQRDRAWTPKEFEDFIGAAPETQYAKLRTQQAAARNYRPGPTEERGGTITVGGVPHDFMSDNSPGIRTDHLRDVEHFQPGTQPFQDLNTDLPTLTRPVGTRRPTTQLAASPMTFRYAPNPTF